MQKEDMPQKGEATSDHKNWIKYKEWVNEQTSTVILVRTD